MITPIKQSDPIWKDCRLGNSMAKMGRYGCYVSCLCMAIEKLTGVFYDPRNAVVKWKFNAKGEIITDKTIFDGMTGIKKFVGYNYSTIAEYANDINKIAILSLNSGSHYIYVLSAENNVLTVIDPVDGFTYVGLPKKYRVTGYRLAEANQSIPEYAKEKWAKAKKIGILPTDPVEEISMERFQEDMVKLGKLKNVMKMPAYRAAVLYDNLGLL